MNIEKLQSSLIMNDFYFSLCEISRSSQISNGALSVDVDREVQHKEEHVYCVTLTLTVEKGDELNLKVVANAEFEFSTNGNGDEDKIIKYNTVAIMFPFIRSQVSLLTTQPGMSPILLPPIDTSKLVD